MKELVSLSALLLQIIVSYFSATRVRPCVCACTPFFSGEKFNSRLLLLLFLFVSLFLTSQVFFLISFIFLSYTHVCVVTEFTFAVRFAQPTKKKWNFSLISFLFLKSETVSLSATNIND